MLPRPTPQPRPFNGFTLAEVIITLGVLGLLVAMVVPSVTQVKQHDGIYKLQLQSAVARVSAAYEQYKLDFDPPMTLTLGTLAPYLRGSRLLTSSTYINDWGVTTSLRCATTPGAVCYALGDGAVVATIATYRFGQGSETNLAERCLPILIDLDGKHITQATPDLNSRSALFLLMYDGRMIAAHQLKTTCKSYTTASGGSHINWTPAAIAAGSTATLPWQ
jgi:prepilin-type N-terminal cleavage/methylation domain-containing protein